jgi:hypothetical protein
MRVARKDEEESSGAQRIRPPDADEEESDGSHGVYRVRPPGADDEESDGSLALHRGKSLNSLRINRAEASRKDRILGSQRRSYSSQNRPRRPHRRFVPDDQLIIVRKAPPASRNVDEVHPAPVIEEEEEEEDQVRETIIIVKHAPPPRPHPGQVDLTQLRRLPGEKPKVVAVMEAREFKRVRRVDPEKEQVRHRRTITPDGKEYEYEYDYSYGDGDGGNEPRCNTAAANSAPRFVMDQFPMLGIPLVGRQTNDGSELPRVTNEELMQQIEQLKIQLAEQTERRDATRERLQAIEQFRKPRPLFCWQPEAITIKDPPIVLERTAVIDRETETLVAGSAIEDQLRTLSEQQKDVMLVTDLDDRQHQLRVELEKAEAAMNDSDVRLTMENSRVEQLRKDIIVLRDELDQADQRAVEDEKRTQVIQREVKKAEQQTRQSELTFEKVSNQLLALQQQWEDLIRFRQILETELNDIYCREKPEVRQLTADVKAAKQQVEIDNGKMHALQKRIDAERTELRRVQDSQEMKTRIEYQLQLKSLAIKREKWEMAMNLPELARENEAGAQQRAALKAETRAKERELLLAQEQLDLLERYDELLASILADCHE